MGSLFSAADAERYTQLAKERKDSLDKPPTLKQGIHLAKLVKVEGGLTKDTSNHPNRAKVVLHWQDAKEENAIVREDLVIQGDENWVEVKRKQLSERIVNGFGQPFKPAESLEQLVKWLNGFVGKPLKIAIQLEQGIWEKMTGPHNDVEDWQLVEKPRIWYVGLHNEDLESRFNESKSIVMLSAVEQQKWDEYKQRSGKGEGQGTHAAASAKPTPTPTPAPTEAKTSVASDLDLPDMSAKPAKAKPAAAVADDDDLPEMPTKAAAAKAEQPVAAAVESEDPLAFLNGPGQ